jgi:hypothetical protein
VLLCLECEPKGTLIGKHGVDHRAFDNQLAVNVRARRARAGMVSLVGAAEAIGPLGLAGFAKVP